MLQAKPNISRHEIDFFCQTISELPSAFIIGSQAAGPYGAAAMVGICIGTNKAIYDAKVQHQPDCNHLKDLALLKGGMEVIAPIAFFNSPIGVKKASVTSVKVFAAAVSTKLAQEIAKNVTSFFTDSPAIKSMFDSVSKSATSYLVLGVFFK